MSTYEAGCLRRPIAAWRSLPNSCAASPLISAARAARRWPPLREPRIEPRRVRSVTASRVRCVRDRTELVAREVLGLRLADADLRLRSRARLSGAASVSSPRGVALDPPDLVRARAGTTDIYKTVARSQGLTSDVSVGQPGLFRPDSATSR